MSFNPDQARDDHGKWTGGGASSSGKVQTSAEKALNAAKVKLRTEALEHSQKESPPYAIPGITQGYKDGAASGHSDATAADTGAAGSRELGPGEFGNNPRFAPEPRNPITDESVNEEGRRAQAASDARSSIRDEIEARRSENIERVRANAASRPPAGPLSGRELQEHMEARGEPGPFVYSKDNSFGQGTASDHSEATSAPTRAAGSTNLGTPSGTGDVSGQLRAARDWAAGQAHIASRRNV